MGFFSWVSSALLSRPCSFFRSLYRWALTHLPRPSLTAPPAPARTRAPRQEKETSEEPEETMTQETKDRLAEVEAIARQFQLLKEENEALAVQTPGQSTSAFGDLSDTDRLAQATRLLQPGMHYVGVIGIPGNDRADRYVLEVLAEDPEFPTEPLASHGAYDDEQPVYLRLTFPHEDQAHASQVKVEYHDLETFCLGWMDTTTQTIVGEVKQLASALEEGFYNNEAGPVLNTFTLSLVREPDRLRQIRVEKRLLLNSLWGPLKILFEVLEKAESSDQRKPKKRKRRTASTSNSTSSSSSSSASSSSVPQSSEDKDGDAGLEDDSDVQFAIWQVLAPLPWLEFLNYFGQLGAEYTARLLRWTDWLKGLTFATVQEKTEILETKVSRTISRAKIQQEMDEVTDRIVVPLTKTAEQGLLQRVDIVEVIARVKLVVHARMAMAYQRLDTALRMCEVRLPNSAIESRSQKIESLPEDDHEEGNDEVAAATAKICSVCMTGCGTELGEVVVVLDCDHMFHRGCLGQWFHNHNSCPNCRQQVSER